MQTIDEAAKKSALKTINPIYNKNGIGASIHIAAFKSGVSFAQLWIPVEEELPEKQGHFLVKVLNSFPKNCDVIVAEFYDDNHVFYCEYSDRPIKDVTHWRPIELK